MKRITAFAIVMVSLVASDVVSAQETSPRTFVPFQVGKSEMHQLNTLIGDIPVKYALPLMDYLAQLEISARSAEKPAQPKAPEGQK